VNSLFRHRPCQAHLFHPRDPALPAVVAASICVYYRTFSVLESGDGIIEQVLASSCIQQIRALPLCVERYTSQAGVEPLFGRTSCSLACPSWPAAHSADTSLPGHRSAGPFPCSSALEYRCPRLFSAISTALVSMSSSSCFRYICLSSDSSSAKIASRSLGAAHLDDSRIASMSLSPSSSSSACTDRTCWFQAVRQRS
jgi:hypothetical protein